MKKKIVIVEDDFIIKLFISKVLGNSGYEIVGEATNCDQVLELLEVCEPDVILMDIGIAGNLDGIETVIKLRTKHNYPVIYVTGNSDDATIKRAENTHPVGIIYKPIDEVKLLARLQELLATLDTANSF